MKAFFQRPQGGGHRGGTSVGRKVREEKRMKPKSIEKRAAVRSAVLSTLFQVMAAGALLYLRSVTQTGWLRGLR